MKSKRFFLLVAVALAMCSGSSAAILCPQGTLQDYLNTVNPAGGCTIDDKLFTDFSYASAASGGAAMVPASGVAVTPVGPPPPGADIGFIFNAFWSAGSNQTVDSTIRYTITSTGAPIIDATLFMGGLVRTGTGIASVGETLCLGASMPPCPGGTQNLQVFADGGMTLQDHIVFSGQTTVGVVKDIGVSGGTNGTATISEVRNTFSQIPEPASLLLIGPALFGLGTLRRKTKDS